jgi:hypothetical protein
MLAATMPIRAPDGGCKTKSFNCWKLRIDSHCGDASERADIEEMGPKRIFAHK